MFNWIDAQLNKVTMYRLLVYVLLFLIGVALVFSSLGVLPYSPFALIFSVFLITTICLIINEICGYVYSAPVNVESIYITAFILALIISPPTYPLDPNYFSLAIWASVWAMASKFLFAIRKKHLFNPAAFAVALTALTINQSASWWVATYAMLPFVVISGLLIVKKLRRFDLVASFFLVTLVATLGAGIWKGADLWTTLSRVLVDSPLFFFAFIMLTEPLTSPPTKTLRVIYGAIVGFLFTPWVHIGSFYMTPEIAIVLGNAFSYIVSPKHKFTMFLKQQLTVAENTIDFLFHPDRQMNFKPGQYMEWTLAHAHPDRRGNRRYFTIASSPTEEDLRLGVKFYPNGSSYKHALSSMVSTDMIVASQLAGDFVLPKNPNEKLVFIAGGIGVTPFRSMIKYLVDTHEK